MSLTGLDRLAEQMGRLFERSEEESERAITEAFFVESLREVAKECHEAAKNKGFWDNPRDDLSMIMLVVTELSEAVEGIRHRNPPSDKIPEFSVAEEEFADALIRMMDQWTARGWRVPEAVLAKLEYNRTRPYMHGKTA